MRLDAFGRCIARSLTSIQHGRRSSGRLRDPCNDPSTMLSLVAVGAQGEPARARLPPFLGSARSPASKCPATGTRELKDVFEYGVVDGAWLAEHVLQGLSPERQARLGCFAFGQRVFGSAAAEELDDALVAIRACMRFPALVMTLERAGVRRPATYASAARRARAIEDVGDPVRRSCCSRSFKARCFCSIACRAPGRFRVRD